MAPTDYQYTISTDFPTGRVNITQLLQTITYDPAITIAIDPQNGINANSPDLDKCNIWFVDPLPVPDQAALDGIVAAHLGYGGVVTLLGSMPIREQAVIEDLTWQPLESIITTPGFFVNNDAALLPQLMARVINQIMGDGGQLKVTEEMEGQPDVDILPEVNLADTLGAWLTAKYDSSTPPRDGVRNRYVVKARLNGATNLAVRSGSISMIRVIIY